MLDTQKMVCPANHRVPENGNGVISVRLALERPPCTAKTERMLFEPLEVVIVDSVTE
jgi:hypothetical protein